MDMNFYFFTISFKLNKTNVFLKYQIKKEYEKYGKVRAIKLHRELTGSYLYDAKQYVDKFDSMFNFYGGLK